FAPGQPVALSDDVTSARAEVTGGITIFDADDRLLLTLDTYKAAEVPTTVQLSWRRLDEARFPIDKPGMLPPDLRHLAMLLEEANVAGFAGAGEPPLTGVPELNQQLVAERDQLRDRLIRVTWVVGENGTTGALIVSGQLPVYDDVEAVFGREDPTGTTYGVTGLTSIASEEALRHAGQDYPAYVQDRYLQLPSSTTFRTRALAAALVQEAGAANPFDQAIAIQNALRQRIRYEEQFDPPPDDQDAVDYVLFDSQEGYCEYYASAMAVMLRSLGIPARIAVGYYPAEYDAEEAGYLYRQRNAHAWVEAYFPDYGWIPFEPTASRPPRDYGDSRLADPAGDGLATPTPEPTVTLDPVPTATPRTLPPAATTDSDNGDGNQGIAAWVARGMAGAFLLLTGLMMVTALLWRRGLGGLSAANALWARVLKAGCWIGIRPDPAMTPFEYADELGRAIPAAHGPASRVASLYTVERYAETSSVPGVDDYGNGAWRELRRTMARSWAKRRVLRRR
ncbi:MAG TPA: transglutaminase domain-containing protein, partial [Thermomicrobiales bacterium]|nr:transglutaminase domain-containing protein [Thermomicrobiales bacterium]